MEGLTVSFGLLLAMSSADTIWLWAGGALALL